MLLKILPKKNWQNTFLTFMVSGQILWNSSGPGKHFKVGQKRDQMEMELRCLDVNFVHVLHIKLVEFPLLVSLYHVQICWEVIYALFWIVEVKRSKILHKLNKRGSCILGFICYGVSCAKTDLHNKHLI